MKFAYYNEIDPFAAEWLRNLISAGHITPGIVDERSIEDVTPDELREFAQCHFFAGIGVWSYALRLAGWPDDKPVWTGSCPCQPFSSAGKGGGFTDERHLWPAFFHLIEQRRPAVMFGEQVASKDADAWIDLVQDDMEAVGYGFAAIPFPSASVGAPHIRDRLFWMGNAADAGLEGFWSGHQAESGRQREAGSVATAGELGGVADAAGEGRRSEWPHINAANCNQEIQAGQEKPGRCGAADPAGQTNGFWRNADWLLCRDGKWRPVEPGAFPLAHGAAARVGRLRAYGNAINAQAAAEFIRAAMIPAPANDNQPAGEAVA